MSEVEEKEVSYQDHKASRAQGESSAAAADAQDAKPTDTVEQAEPRRSRGGFQDRIDELTKQKYEAIQKNNELLAKIALLSESKTAKPEPIAAVVDDDPEPTEDQFYDQPPSAFTKAQAAWVARQTFKELSAKQQTQSKEAERRERDKEIVATYYERTSEFAKAQPDFDEVVAKIRIAEDNSLAVQAAIFADEHGPAIAYHLGQHPEVCEKLSELPMPRALALIGKISEGFDTDSEEKADSPEEEAEKPAPRPRKESAAPEPIQPVRGATRAVAVPIGNLEYQEYKKARLAGRS